MHGSQETVGEPFKTMRILIASPYLPWPLNSGGNAAQFSTLKCLEEDHEFTLVCPIYDEAGVASAKELQVRLPRVRVRAVACGSPPVQPMPNPGWLVRVARKAVHVGRKLLNPPVSSPSPEPAQAAALHYPFDPLPEKLISALEEEMAGGFDLFQAEFAEMLPLGLWCKIPKLFIHHQVHFVYAERYLKTYGTTPYLRYLESVMKAQEVNYLREFQGIITFGDEDRRALLPYVAPERLFASPFPVPADVGITDKLPPSFEGQFLFLASEQHLPNRDGLEWLLGKIWPQISAELPSARLVVIGQWSEAGKARFAAPGVVFPGFVEDLGSRMRGGIMLVPLRIGSGIRVKIMVAMGQGTPVVSTSVGSEGMPVRDGEELLVRDDAVEFAKAAIQLAKDTALWKRLGIAGWEAVRSHYSMERVRQRRNQIYQTIVPSAGSASPRHQPLVSMAARA